MKHRLVNLLGLSLVLLIWFWWNYRSTPTQGHVVDSVQAPQAGSSSVTNPLPHDSTSERASSSDKVSVLVPPKRVEIPEHAVEYQVVEGVAVAAGDIIVGVLEPGQPTAGYARVDAPDTWPDGVVPIAFADGFQDPDRVRLALDRIQKATKIRFVDYRGGDGVVFENAKETCLSPLGRRGGLQPIRLAPSCGTRQILHEMMHTLGFIHEHQRSDRDAHVEILWKNIDEKFADQFALIPNDWMELAKGISFDDSSILMYFPDAFTQKKGMNSIRRRDGRSYTPATEYLSAGDIEKIARAYGE